jgi:hypothetical protein
MCYPYNDVLDLSAERFARESRRKCSSSFSMIDLNHPANVQLELN